MAIIVPEIFADCVNEEFDKELVVGRIATDYTDEVGEIRDYGDKVHFPVIDLIGDAEEFGGSVTSLTPEALSMTDNEAEIKHTGKAVVIKDKDAVQIKGGAKEELAKQIGYKLALKVDADLVNTLKTDAVYKDTCAIADFDRDVMEGLFDVFGDKQNDDSFAGILINPRLKKYVMDMNDFTDLHKSYVVAQNGVTIQNCIGHWHGVIPVILCGNETYDADKKEAVVALVKKGALGYCVSKQPSIEEQRDILAKATNISADEMYATILKNKAGVSVLTVTLQ